jgi:glycerophosphoryl diester phosphodiesterase
MKTSDKTNVTSKDPRISGGIRDDRWRLWPYFQTLPGILYYQIVSAVILGVLLYGIEMLSSVLMSSTGHEAVTSGDFTFLFTTWQGWLLILLAVIVLCLYSIFDLNVKMIYSRSVLDESRLRTREILKEAVRSFRKLTGVRGFILILYIAVIVPLFGIGFSTRLTQDLEIPNFIFSVIIDMPAYLAAYLAFSAFMIIEGLRYLFTFHAVVLDGMTVKEGAGHAKKIMRDNWRSFIPHYILFLIIIGGCAAAVMGAAILIPDALVSMISQDAAGSRFFSVFMALLDSVLFLYFYEIMTPLMILELTRYYRMYTDGTKIFVPRASKKRHIGRVVRIGVLIAALLVTSGVMTVFFDTLFPKESTVGIVAHRTGGTLAFENSAEGIKKAAAYDAVGSETDVQRTADGKYIINHDNTFERLYGVDKKPSEMTLAEIRKLRTKDGEKVPTLEELLDTAKKENIRLYIELKGSTADRRMVDDVVRIVRKKGMTRDTALISLKYDVLDYAESRYPEFETGYLYFLSFGDTTKLNVDDLIIEEQIATGANISALKMGGKRVIVWTVNEEKYLEKLLAGNADGIITDKVKRACEIKQEMKKRDNRERASDRIEAWMAW